MLPVILLLVSCIPQECSSCSFAAFRLVCKMASLVSVLCSLSLFDVLFINTRVSSSLSLHYRFTIFITSSSVYLDQFLPKRIVLHFVKKCSFILYINYCPISSFGIASALLLLSRTSHPDAFSPCKVPLFSVY